MYYFQSMKQFRLFIFIFMAINSVAHEPRVIVYSFEINGINSSHKKSIYSEFLKFIKHKTQVNFEIEYLPPLRAIKDFLKNKDSCLFPFNKDINITEAEVILSKPIGEIQLFAINKRGKSRITNKNLSKFKRIGVKTIYENKIKFPEDAIVYFLESDDQLFEMLRYNRVDVILESVPDVYLYFRDGKLGFDREFQYDNTQKIKTFDDFFACHSHVAKATKLIEMIDKKVVY